MPALLIVNYDVKDRAALDGYRQAAGPLLVGPDLGEAIAISSDTVDLGEGTPAGKDTVVLKFASVEAAKLAWHSDAYQAVINQRLDATFPKIGLIVETLS